MKRMKILPAIAIFVIVAFVGTRIFPANPLWQSQKALKVWILKEVPFGSPIGSVKALVKRQRWKLLSEWRGSPVQVSSDKSVPSIRDYPGLKGEYFIHADLGYYQGVPFRVGVDAYWGFDAAGQLVDLRVRKGAEGL